MSYTELVQMYFERSNALQWYWTLYVIVIGGLLAFSSLRQRGDLVTCVLITVLYGFFAYKNLDAIRDVSMQRFAVLDLIKQKDSGTEAGIAKNREALEPTLNPIAFEDARNFHLATDVVTVLAFWAMEWRRRRAIHLPHAPM